MKMSESRELELHTVDGGGHDIIKTEVDNGNINEKSAEDKPFRQFFRRVPANLLCTPAPRTCKRDYCLYRLLLFLRHISSVQGS